MEMLPGFLAAVLLVSATPGPAMALVVRRAALQGPRATVPTVLGLEVGLYVWALLAGFGLAAVVAASEVAYLVLRVVGAAVLLVLGVRAWRNAWRHHREPGHDGDPGTPPGRPWRRFTEGLLVQLANPKAAMFLFAFYPQFVPADGPVLALTAALAGLQVLVETVLYLGLASAVGTVREVFSRPAVRARLEAVSGTVLVALGLRAAVAA